MENHKGGTSELRSLCRSQCNAPMLYPEFRNEELNKEEMGTWHTTASLGVKSSRKTH